jgi:hypothetical protein
LSWCSSYAWSRGRGAGVFRRTAFVNKNSVLSVATIKTFLLDELRLPCFFLQPWSLASSLQPQQTPSIALQHHLLLPHVRSIAWLWWLESDSSCLARLALANKPIATACGWAVDPARERRHERWRTGYRAVTKQPLPSVTWRRFRESHLCPARNESNKRWSGVLYRSILVIIGLLAFQAELGGFRQRGTALEPSPYKSHSAFTRLFFRLWAHPPPPRILVYTTKTPTSIGALLSLCSANTASTTQTDSLTQILLASGLRVKDSLRYG